MALNQPISLVNNNSYTAYSCTLVKGVCQLHISKMSEDIVVDHSVGVIYWPMWPSLSLSGVCVRDYFGSPGGYGYYHLKVLEKRERFIYPIPNFHGKMPRYGHFRCAL